MIENVPLFSVTVENIVDLKLLISVLIKISLLVLLPYEEIIFVSFKTLLKQKLYSIDP